MPGVNIHNLQDLLLFTFLRGTFCVTEQFSYFAVDGIFVKKLSF